MKIAIIYDVPGWAYYAQAVSLKKYAPGHYKVDIFPLAAVPWNELNSYNVSLWLHYSCIPDARQKMTALGVNIPVLACYGCGPYNDDELWESTLRNADFVVVNNAYRWMTGGKRQRTCCIANGIDEEIFHPTTPISERPHKCLWLGSMLQSELKGYQAVILPLQEELGKRGFEFDFRLIDSYAATATLSELAGWYDTGSYILCASLAEGTPNPILEGMSCGCVPVSTFVGNIREFGRNLHNCVIAERTVGSFLSALEYARQHRDRLSANAVETMNSWAYGRVRAQYFYRLWYRLARDGADSIPPFRYDELEASEI